MYPTKMKAMASNWICNYAVVQATLPGIENLGYKFWIVWAVICFAFIPITYLFYPETANSELHSFREMIVLLTQHAGSLEDIDRFFETKPGIIICRNKLATQLARPQVYADQDEEIARKGEKGGVYDDEKDDGHVTVEKMA